MTKRSLGAKTVLCPLPVLVIGSYDGEGRANIMTVSWGGICCSDPPSVAVSVRRGRYSYEGIAEHEAFTVNVPSASQVRDADYAGIYSGRDEDKLKALGLRAVKSELVNAPYIEEFPLVLECALRQTIKLGVHTQFIGEIMDVKIDEEAVDEQGRPDVSKIQPFIFAPGDGWYYRVGERMAQSYSVGKK